VIAEKIKAIVSTFPSFFFFGRKFAGASVHLTSVQIINISLPPRRIREPFEFFDYSADCPRSLRQLQNLVIGID